jgi:hypothetical protein
VPEEDLITEDEAIELVKSILMETGYEHYALDGLIFLFHSLSEWRIKTKFGQWIYLTTSIAFSTAKRYIAISPNRNTLIRFTKDTAERTTITKPKQSIETFKTKLIARSKNKANKYKSRERQNSRVFFVNTFLLSL